MDNTKKFDGKADIYKSARPAYSEKLIDFLYGSGFSANSQIADIGSGTGIFAKQLLDRGSTVYGVEPNGDMRRAAEEKLSAYPRFISVNGTSESTGLGACSVDIVTAAQAFHWFDARKFAEECKRILRAGGFAVIVYNSRDVSQKINTESFKIFKKYCPDFIGFGGGMSEKNISEFFGGKFKKISFDNPLIYNKESFIKRSLSSSYALTPSDKEYEKFLSELENLFDEQSVDGAVELCNVSSAYMGGIKCG